MDTRDSDLGDDSMVSLKRKVSNCDGKLFSHWAKNEISQFVIDYIWHSAKSRKSFCQTSHSYLLTASEKKAAEVLLCHKKVTDFGRKRFTAASWMAAYMFSRWHTRAWGKIETFSLFSSFNSCQRTEEEKMRYLQFTDIFWLNKQ